jgi:hypothetical protein
VLVELLFEVGRWDEALAECSLGVGVSKDPFVECMDRGVAATIQLHRGDDGAAQHLAEVQPCVGRAGGRISGPLMLAMSLGREQADKPAEALAVLLTSGLSERAEELEESADLLADGMRLALRVGDEHAARTVLDRADAVARSSSVPHRQAVALHCYGLLDRDPGKLSKAAEHYRAAGRVLPRAQALEAAGVACAASGDTPGAGTCFGAALSLYTELGANWDITRVQTLFRKCGSAIE